MKIKYAKALRSIAKIVLLLCFLSLLGLGIFFTYKSLKYKPYKVRVSNVTDSAFTVSWVTDEPMVGVVYYAEKDSFLPGPLAWIGKSKAVDDRDVSNAQTECVSEFNKKASKTKDDNFTVDIEGYDCNNVKVVKKGRYYTHHVTVQNLDAEKEYYFRVGDGYISYAKNSGTYTEGEVEGIDTFATKTKSVFTDIPTPNPAYGTTETVYNNEMGYVLLNKDYDSIVFLVVKNEDNEYGVFSSVANNDGGWSIDLSNVRDEDGDTVNLDNSILVFMPQAENHKAFVFEEYEYWDIEYPLRLPGNRKGDIKLILDDAKLNSLLFKFSRGVEAATDGGMCAWEEFAGWTNKSCDVCAFKCYAMIGGQKTFTYWNTRECNESKTGYCQYVPDPVVPDPVVPDPVVPEPPVVDDDNLAKCYKWFKREDGALYCSQALDEKITVGLCRSGYGGAWGDNKCTGLSTDVNIETKKMCYYKSNCEPVLTYPISKKECDELSGTQEQKEGCNNPPATPPSDPTPPLNPEVVVPCYYKVKSKGNCVEETNADNCVELKNENNYYESDKCLLDLKYYKWKDNQCIEVGSLLESSFTNDPTCDGRTNAGNYCVIWNGWQCNEYQDDKQTCFLNQNRKSGYYTSMLDCINDHPTRVSCTLFCKDTGSCTARSTVYNCNSLAAQDGKDTCSYTERSSEFCTSTEEYIELSEDNLDGRLKISPFKTYAQNSNNTEGNYVYHVPESGTYLFKLLRGEEKKIVSDGKTSYYFYYNRNGEEGYQEPEDLSNVKTEEDLLVEAEVAVISISKIAAAKEIQLSQGINIVSFDFMPNSIDDPFTSPEFLKLANKNGNKVSHISYFSAGQWDGGTSYDFETKETKGVSFDLGFGKGYIIVAEEDTTVTIPGYNVQSAVPIAFSSGWNLVGVHGYDTQYTANSLINSINTIEGLKSNNVTYWPTSKGMYQGYQLSEGQSYGQDFPISKDLGYFVRISEFNASDDSCKSIIWNPGGDLNGKCGSSN